MVPPGQVLYSKKTHLPKQSFAAHQACAETVRDAHSSNRRAGCRNGVPCKRPAPHRAQGRGCVLLLRVATLPNAAIVGVCATGQCGKRRERLRRGLPHSTNVRPRETRVSTGYEKETATLKFSFLMLRDADTDSSSRFLRVLLSDGLFFDVLLRVFMSSSIVE